MKIGLLGDTHGSEQWMLYAIYRFREVGINTVIQLGDLGVWPGSHRMWERVNTALRDAGQTWHVVPGNHEDYDQIQALPYVSGGWQCFYSNIYLAPRGLRWDWGGLDFVALGGAPSVDRSFRASKLNGEFVKNPRGWWPEEAITESDVAQVVQDGVADVMIAHDAPLGVKTIEARIASNPHGFKQVDLQYAAEGRKLMTEAFEAVQPRFFFHGHYHFQVIEEVQTNRGHCVVAGLSCDGEDYSMGAFDTESRSVEFWKATSGYRDFLRGKINERLLHK